MEQKSNPKAVASLVLGILSLVCIFLNYFAILGVVMGIVGLVLGIAANKEAKSGMGTAGIVLSAVGLGLCAISFVACVACVSCLGIGCAGLGSLS